MSHFWPVTAHGYSVPGNHPVRPTCPRHWRLSSAKRSVARSRPLGSQALTLPDSLAILSGATNPRQHVRYSLVLISEIIPHMAGCCQALTPLLLQIGCHKKRWGGPRGPPQRSAGGIISLLCVLILIQSVMHYGSYFPSFQRRCLIIDYLVLAHTVLHIRYIPGPAIRFIGFPIRLLMGPPVGKHAVKYL